MVFNDFFSMWALPFLLVFVVLFAILEKSKVLGDGKRQINSMAALAIALITVLVGPAREVIVNMMPWLSVGVAVILVFLILYGFVAGELTEVPEWMKITFGILAGLFTIGVVLYATGIGRIVYDWFASFGNGGAFMNVIVIIVILAVVVVAVMSGKKD